ncbi:ATP-binding protein [Lactobacillus sp. PV034]|uniref:ATP-binding protein n=1 Tax=Lactobacillus sp. PV034 TaxID=2594495 RepID=UPI002240CE93|nr:ATP-binding protein [Lactobacillus sp. PV034]QNQ81127.1 HAMP domain-containing protein [Lactobacillus sp. PV034]
MKNKKKLYSRSTIIYSSVIAFIIVCLICVLLYGIIVYAPYGIMPKNGAPYIVGGGATVSLFVLVFIIVYLILNPLLRSLNKLVVGMQKVADGDLKTRLPDKSSRLLKKPFENFNKMAAELDSTELLKEDFVSQFSHEFKTPISSINGFAKLLTDKNVPATKKEEYAAIIAEESERLSKLSGQVMMLTNLENRSIVTKKENIEIDEELRKTIISLLPAIEAKKLNYELNLVKISYHTNAELLKEVWINLINNSIKFTPEGGTIFVACKENKSQVRVLIGNNGPEISEEDKQKIFDKFYQGETDAKSQGLGLGLAIVSKIINLLNGKINILSDYQNNKGTFFEIILPK